MHESVSTICLTATAYDGVEQGLEKSIIDQMGQSIYYNSSEKADFIPKIHEEDDFGSFDDYCKMISEERKKCGVLVYATGELYDKLIVENIGEAVKADTNYKLLETMDWKTGDRFPIYIINDKYGGRGCNFRAP